MKLIEFPIISIYLPRYQGINIAIIIFYFVFMRKIKKAGLNVLKYSDFIKKNFVTNFYVLRLIF